MNEIRKRELGVREGVARSLSQSLVYGLEVHKTRLQLTGRGLNRPLHSNTNLSISLLTGMSTSSLTAGFVFFTYYSIYNRLHHAGNPFAGIVASFITSIVKLPIGNSMRLMQSGAKGATNVFKSGKQLYAQNGLYKGYGVSLIEDTIEMDMKSRIYNNVNTRASAPTPSQPSEKLSGAVLKGALAGAISSGVTTPFDTVRAHMCYNVGARSIHIGPLRTVAHICNTYGAKSLFRGMHVRVATNAIKSAVFFAIFELLSFI